MRNVPTHTRAYTFHARLHIPRHATPRCVHATRRPCDADPAIATQTPTERTQRAPMDKFLALRKAHPGYTGEWSRLVDAYTNTFKLPLYNKIYADFITKPKKSTHDPHEIWSIIAESLCNAIGDDYLSRHGAPITHDNYEALSLRILSRLKRQQQPLYKRLFI